MLRNSLSLVLSVMLSTATMAADTYKLDPSHSKVGFSIRHMAISRTHGAFDQWTMDLQYDPAQPAQSVVSATIQVSSINTQNENRDAHLKSPDFFDVATHPLITFTSKSAKPAGKKLLVTGDLTMKGITREVILPCEILGPTQDPWGNTRIGAEAELEINRQNFGLTSSKSLPTGGLVIGNTVKIEISLEAVKQR